MKGILTFLFLVALLGSAQPCPEGQVLCEGTEDECIPEEYVCDYEYLDCSNDWDETNCPCRPDQWTCANGECIWAGQDCDGYKHCGDNSDETDCVTCRVFQCEDGKCLNKYQLCDGRDDCLGGEDEEPGCPKCDPRFLWTCADLSCIFKTNVCDGYPDCPDGSDEWNCTMAGLETHKGSHLIREEEILGARKGSEMSPGSKRPRRKINRKIENGPPKAGILPFMKGIRPSGRNL